MLFSISVAIVMYQFAQVLKLVKVAFTVVFFFIPELTADISNVFHSIKTWKQERR